jgi:hypothetical protein
MMLGDDRVAAEGYPLVCVHTNFTFEKFISRLAFVSYRDLCNDHSRLIKCRTLCQPLDILATLATIITTFL